MSPVRSSAPAPAGGECDRPIDIVGDLLVAERRADTTP
jgi:hypothetical protein